MRLDIKTPQDLQNYIHKLDNHIKKNHKLKWIKYVTLGSKTARLVSYSDQFLSHAERQLTYTLKDNADHYDATIILWNEKDVTSVANELLGNIHPHRAMLEKIVTKKDYIDAKIFDEKYSSMYPIIDTVIDKGLVNAFDESTQTYYYGVQDLNPEEFAKTGHMLAIFFNKITKTPKTGIVHGAVIGLEDEGVLFCARGQRGKSTLSVLSMIEGFDYVSDDYLILEQEDDKLYSYPIYSIITLSPRMYDELYDKLEGSRFISNNARKDKYIVNIKNFHDQFKSKYPIKFCMFPEIVADKDPSIVPCPKGRAICQLVQSTVFQLQDGHNHDVIKKLMDMVHNYEFYQINLCQDIARNTEFLRDFMKNYEHREQATFVEDRMYADVTFNLANILDSQTGIIYRMNEFATNLYENLMAGVAREEILSQLMAVKNMPKTMKNDFNTFVDVLLEKKIIKNLASSNQQPDIKLEFIKKCNFELSVREFTKDTAYNLVKHNKKEK